MLSVHRTGPRLDVWGTGVVHWHGGRELKLTVLFLLIVSVSRKSFHKVQGKKQRDENAKRERKAC